MKGYRYVSDEELIVLVQSGVINTITAPYAVIGENEKLKDCHPAPAVGSVMFFAAGSKWYPYDSEGYVRLTVEIPDDEVVSFHVGEYREYGEDYDGNTILVHIYQRAEFAARELKIEWVTGIEVCWCSDWAILKNYPHIDPRKVEAFLSEEWCKKNPNASPNLKMFPPTPRFDKFWDYSEQMMEVMEKAGTMMTVKTNS